MVHKSTRGSIKLTALVRKAENGELTIDEARFIASDFSNGNETYQRIFALGLSGFTEFIPLLEKYVFDTKHLTTAAEALIFLFIHYRRAEYKDVVLRFMAGVPWDDEDELKRAATYIAGQFLSKNKDKDLLRSLIRTYETSTEPGTKGAAAENLLRSAGIPWREIPPGMAAEEMPLDVVEKLKAELADNHS